MNILCKYDELVSPKSLKPHPKNRNKHPIDQIERLAKLIEYQGVRAPIVVSKLSGNIVKGHGTLMALQKLKTKEIPVVYQEFKDDDQEYAFLQSDNAIASWAELDFSGINLDVENIGPDFDIDWLGIKDFTVDVSEKQKNNKMSDQFGAAPFSVLNAREGWWQDRKREWIDLGISSEIGRGGAVYHDHQWMVEKLDNFQASKAYLREKEKE